MGRRPVTPSRRGNSRGTATGWRHVADYLARFPVIPAVRGVEDAREALSRPGAAVLVFKGTIFTLREILRLCGSDRPVLVHVDLLEGIGRDEAGIQFLGVLGVRGITSTRGHLVRLATRSGLIAVQRFFAVDSDALATGIAAVREAAPHAVEVLPGPMVPYLMPSLVRDLGLPIIGAGLITHGEQARSILRAGAVGISASRKDLWGLENDDL